MSEEIRVNRPMPQTQSAAPSMAAPMEEAGTKSKMPWVILAVVVIVIAVLGVLFRDKLFGAKSTTSKVQGVSTSNYQAVFLSNGQVYFGKVSNPEGNYVTLSDIFYLQVVQPPLQGQQQPGQPVPAQTNQPQISLVKLGNELHGPIDEMKVNRDHILFYEDLKADGQVVQAINNYKANPTK